MSEAGIHGSVLAARQVRKTYRSGEHPIAILGGVDLAVHAGESVSVCGVSGCGKSTLLNLLAGLDQPDAGEIIWEGLPIATRAAAALAVRRRTFLGMIFQSFHLVPELDVLENLLLPARIAGMEWSEARRRAMALLERVGLGGRMGHLPNQLSGGECQRAAIARALLNAPRVVLADEPTGNLDERAAAGVIELILSLCVENGAAVVLVTHNPLHASRTARKLILSGGSLHA